MALTALPIRLQARLDASEFICGSDECGLGSWAGNLTVCAVVVKQAWTFPGVRDSKKLTPSVRARLHGMLTAPDSGVLFHVVQVTPQRIDEIGVGKALRYAHMEAITAVLDQHKARGAEDMPMVIIDGNKPVLDAEALPKADDLIPAVSAASIIGKVEHDRTMMALDKLYPGYGFATNQGYGTAAHQAALKTLGLCPAHRRSYSPMKEMV